MPTYEYECKSCGHTFEVFQSISEEPKKHCPECGKDVRRLFGGGTGIIFKGSGFYNTDSRKSSSSSGGPKYSPTSKADAGAASKDGESSPPKETKSPAEGDSSKATQKEGVATK
jgi:putative FmdB family regulatory protein